MAKALAEPDILAEQLRLLRSCLSLLFTGAADRNKRAAAAGGEERQEKGDPSRAERVARRGAGPRAGRPGSGGVSPKRTAPRGCFRGRVGPRAGGGYPENTHPVPPFPPSSSNVPRSSFTSAGAQPVLRPTTDGATEGERR